MEIVRRADRALPGRLECQARAEPRQRSAGDDCRRHRRQGAGRADPAAHTASMWTTSLLVGEDDIEQAIVMPCSRSRRQWWRVRVRCRPGRVDEASRALSRAARWGLILCGGNIEPLVLAEIIERGMVKSGRLARLRLDVRDVPGALADVATLLGKPGCQHRRGAAPTRVQFRSRWSVRSDRGGGADARRGAHRGDPGGDAGRRAIGASASAERFRHSREGGNPASVHVVDPRLRGDDDALSGRRGSC